MPRVKHIFRTHIFCHQCKVTIPINYKAAAEVAKHVGHPCEYTRIAT